jgi:hypothetical protein
VTAKVRGSSPLGTDPPSLDLQGKFHTHHPKAAPIHRSRGMHLPLFGSSWGRSHAIGLPGDQLVDLLLAAVIFGDPVVDRRRDR